MVEAQETVLAIQLPLQVKLIAPEKLRCTFELQLYCLRFPIFLEFCVIIVAACKNVDKSHEMEIRFSRPGGTARYASTLTKPFIKKILCNMHYATACYATTVTKPFIKLHKKILCNMHNCCIELFFAKLFCRSLL